MSNQRPGVGKEFYIGLLWGLTTVAAMLLLGWGIYLIVEILYGW